MISRCRMWGLLITVVATALTLLMYTPSWGALVHLTADMTGAQETAPTPSLGSGHADVTLDMVTHLFSWEVSFAGPFIGTPTAMHFHGRLASDPPTKGAPGQGAPLSNAGVRIGLGVVANPNIGSFDLTTLADYGPFIDADILAGLWYVNLHTDVFPAGEIRGQLQVVPEPSTLLLLGSGLAGVIVFGRKRLRKKV